VSTSNSARSPNTKSSNALEKEITTERWTRIDGEIQRAADETGFIDLRPDERRRF
jgi:hypothetical protein